ncbi:unnamed protein product [Cuscuta campestris]|uniref:Uncharacterized protein n=1 Tax=Cuscuta campestris TaxID=132261 RepID=A0A484M298_9ASTE|nr:unnamed protein product [Cuscuta campestris]
MVSFGIIEVSGNVDAGPSGVGRFQLSPHQQINKLQTSPEKMVSPSVRPESHALVKRSFLFPGGFFVAFLRRY